MNNKQEKQRQVLKRNEGSGGGEGAGPAYARVGIRGGAECPSKIREWGKRRAHTSPLNNRFESSVFLCAFTVAAAGRGSLENVCGPQAYFG